MGYRMNGQRKCSACGKPAIARGLCRTHYLYARKHGTLHEHSTITPVEAFFAKVKKTETCWLWAGTTNDYGYGVFLLPGEKPVRAHRFSYEIANNVSVPANKVVMHVCDNPRCVNPDHLKVGTKRDNNLDSAYKGRKPSGERHWACKLTETQVAAIIADPATHSVIAKKYGISQGHVSRIKSGKVRSGVVNARESH